MTPQRLAEIRERAELSRKRDWVVSREAIADIDGLLEYVGELQGAVKELLDAIPLGDEDSIDEKMIFDWHGFWTAAIGGLFGGLTLVVYIWSLRLRKRKNAGDYKLGRVKAMLTSEDLDEVECEIAFTEKTAAKHNLAEELVDLQTSCETMLEILGLCYFDRLAVRKQVIEKNRARGYYQEAK